MAMGIDLRMWALNIYFLIGLLFALTIIAIITILLISYIRARLWHASVKRTQQADHRAKHHPDGRPYPPTGRGLCDNCQKPAEKVYFLSSGLRLCPDCYRSFDQE